MGDVHHTGLIEVPLGTTLREVIFDIGGGVTGGKSSKQFRWEDPQEDASQKISWTLV